MFDRVRSDWLRAVGLGLVVFASYTGSFGDLYRINWLSLASWDVETEQLNTAEV